MPTPHPEGLVLEVRAQPGAKRQELRGSRNGTLRVRVTQVPEKGKANKAIRKLIAESLGLRVSQIELIAGETASRKKFLLRDVDPEAVRQIVRRLAETD